MGSQFLNFNVAGHRFTTSKDTILKEPASRLALIARGVLPANKDEAGCIFLDRDPRHFQLVLNYLRDGWCALPKSLEERRELLQEARYYQLAGMEAWVRTQDVLGEAALRPQSPDPYSSSNAALSLNLMPAVGSPGTPPQQRASLSAPGGTAGYAGYSTYSAGSEPAASFGPAAGSLSMRNSFLNGANQDLLAAGTAAAAGIRFSSIGPASIAGYTSRSSAAASPEPTAAFSVFGAGTSSSLAYSSLGVPARPSSASPYIGAMGASSSSSSPAGDVAAGYAAGFAAAQQSMLAARRSVSAVDLMALPETSPPAAAASKFLPTPQAQDGFKWTSRYLASNAQMQQVATTLLELLCLPPHASLHAGKTTVSISSECDHDRISGLVGLAAGSSDNRFRYQVVRVKSSVGWSFEFSLRPSSDLALYDKYNIAEYVQDNWFVLAACLKDMYGVVMEEDSSAKPKCVACRRNNVSLILQKVI
uniref:BTB domain-containing protein n=1 Tax=Tetradesmus obliquus TaxID=3088 RepID=A0A383VK31_TETOB|eukprot:jgi/Sobl393_1/4171/SZX65561.1